MKDLLVLDFLWNWKVASTAMLKEVAYKNESTWWVYRALRRLKQEKYIQVLPRGKNLDLELWALTKHGFEVVLMDRDDIDQYRFKVHAPAHDYFATCLQLGDLWQSSIDAQFFTEQQLSSLAKWNFPKELRAIEEHIPDGVTMVRTALHRITIGYEVDLNLKDEERYTSTLKYYEHLDPNLVVWLVRNTWMADKILSLVKNHHRYDFEEKSIGNLYAFVLLDDFKENIWEAKVISGPLAGMSIRKLHAKLIQSQDKNSANLNQKAMKEIFFPKYKSPQKSAGYIKSVPSEKLLTPFGLRGVNNNLNQPLSLVSSNKNDKGENE